MPRLAWEPVDKDCGKRPRDAKISSRMPPMSASATTSAKGAPDNPPLFRLPSLQRGSGGGNSSPSMTPITRSTPASMPAPNSPARKAGRIVSSMTRFETRSVSAPSRPRPTSMRIRRSCCAMSRIAPSSTPLRPVFQASATRIEYCSISSGCVVGTMSTATWDPLRVCRSMRRATRRARSSGCSNAAVSTTGES